MTKRALVLETCKLCPYMKRVRGPGGCSEDWICTFKAKESVTFYGPLPKGTRKIAGYIEYPSEEPEEIPDWCPLPEVEEQA